MAVFTLLYDTQEAAWSSCACPDHSLHCHFIQSGSKTFLCKFVHFISFFGSGGDVVLEMEARACWASMSYIPRSFAYLASLQQRATQG